MNLHRLTDRCLRHVRVDPVPLGPDESFADPPELTAKLRGRASIIRIGLAALYYERAYAQHLTTAPRTSAEGQAERDALDVLGVMARGAELTLMLGDPFKIGRPVLHALEPLARVARMGRWVELNEAWVVIDRPRARRGWNRAVRAILLGLDAVPDVGPVDGETLDARKILAELGGLP